MFNPQWFSDGFLLQPIFFFFGRKNMIGDNYSDSNEVSHWCLSCHYCLLLCLYGSISAGALIMEIRFLSVEEETAAAEWYEELLNISMIWFWTLRPSHVGFSLAANQWKKKKPNRNARMIKAQISAHTGWGPGAGGHGVPLRVRVWTPLCGGV